MARRKEVYVRKEENASEYTRIPTVMAAPPKDVKFSVYSYALNKKAPDDVPEEHKNKGGIEDKNGVKHSFPGNISPEGYFYSPFYEVTLKELDDELQFVNTRRINFKAVSASVNTVTVTFYSPEMGIFEDKDVYEINIVSPVNYNFIIGVPFAIYDVYNDETYRGHLTAMSSVTDGYSIIITTEAKIDEEILIGAETSGRSGYFIAMLEENAPEYAEYVPSSGKLVWRAPKKMSDLASDSPIYNMPFTNGRLYIHRNLNVFVRRQDPHADYKLFRPSSKNPLRRYQVEGDAKIDFDYIKQIIDSMVDAC